MIPENELGVIAVFAQQAEAMGFELISIQATFPDAIVRRAGIDYRVEFEYLASNFQSHKHDPRECDLIICWQNDAPDYVLPTLALSTDDWASTDLALPGQAEREACYWKLRALAAEAQLKNPPQGTNGGDTRAAHTRNLPSRERATVLLLANPNLTGNELGRLLGTSGAWGRKLKSELTSGEAGNGE